VRIAFHSDADGYLSAYFVSSNDDVLIPVNLKDKDSVSCDISLDITIKGAFSIDHHSGESTIDTKPHSPCWSLSPDDEILRTLSFFTNLYDNGFFTEESIAVGKNLKFFGTNDRDKIGEIIFNYKHVKVDVPSFTFKEVIDGLFEIETKEHDFSITSYYANSLHGIKSCYKFSSNRILFRSFDGTALKYARQLNQNAQGHLNATSVSYNGVVNFVKEEGSIVNHPLEDFYNDNLKMIDSYYKFFTA